MPRPRKTYPNERLHVVLRQEIAAELRLRVLSPLTLQGFKKGAISELIETALQEYFAAHPLVDGTPADAEDPAGGLRPASPAVDAGASAPG